MPPVSLKSLASALDLSPSTVSRALHDHPDINPKTKERVLSLAKELNYEINSIAQGLKKRRTNIIGVIIPEIKHDFFSRIISGIEKVAYKAGFVILVCESSEDVEREIVNSQVLAANRIAGLLVSISENTQSASHFESLQSKGIPIVFFDRVCENFNACQVVVDDYGGAFKAVEYLILSGYQRIAHIAGPQQILMSRQRYRGYIDALKKHHRPIIDEHIIFGGLNEKFGIEGIKQLIDISPRPDALFAVNDPVALGAFGVLKKNGLRIPDDIAIIGFSNNRICSFLRPSLTTVDQPGQEIGSVAASLLIDQIHSLDSETDFYPKTEILSTKLIIRQSA